MQITEQMVNEFNSALKTIGCSFKLHIDLEQLPGCGYNPQCKIVPESMMFLHSVIINPNQEFYNVLEKFFIEKGITLSYNNTKDTFWSNDWNIDKTIE